jgi:hypothetical protein
MVMFMSGRRDLPEMTLEMNVAGARALRNLMENPQFLLKQNCWGEAAQIVYSAMNSAWRGKSFEIERGN